MSKNNEANDTTYQVWRTCSNRADMEQELLYYVAIEDLIDYYDNQYGSGAYATLSTEQRKSITYAVAGALGDINIGKAFEKGINSGLDRFYLHEEMESST